MTAQTRELLAWVAREPRRYPDTIEAWRTTCPQHAVWEDALEEDLVAIVRDGGVAHVVVTPRGQALLGGS